MPADPAIEAALRERQKYVMPCAAMGIDRYYVLLATGKDGATGARIRQCEGTRAECEAWIERQVHAAWLEAKAAEIFVPANEAEKHILPWLRTSARALREGDGE